MIQMLSFYLYIFSFAVCARTLLTCFLSLSRDLSYILHQTSASCLSSPIFIALFLTHYSRCFYLQLPTSTTTLLHFLFDTFRFTVEFYSLWQEIKVMPFISVSRTSCNPNELHKRWPWILMLFFYFYGRAKKLQFTCFHLKCSEEDKTYCFKELIRTFQS